MSTANACRTARQFEPVENACQGRCYLPAVDVVESPQELVLTADVPGADPAKIDVRYEDGELRIHAPVAPRQPSEQVYLFQEYGTGDFERTFRLGREIDASKIEARFTDGVLTLKLPKVEAVRPRKIAVNAG